MKHEKNPRPSNDDDVVVSIIAPIDGVPQDEKPLETIIAIFDDRDELINLIPVQRGVATVSLPASQVDRIVQLFHAPVEKEIERPTIARLRRNLAIEQRVLIRPNLEIRLPPAVFKHWQRSCCRVRGRVFTKITLPDGAVQDRPLCNARVVICEVDTPIIGIIKLLSNDLIFRLRNEWLSALRMPAGGTALAPEPPAWHEGLQLALNKEAIVNRTVPQELLALERTLAVDQIRAKLIAHVDLLRLFWCKFDWLHPFYRLDCLKTVEVDENGNLDTEIFYPCYGDHPDLYFKVEQDCHPGGWRTVHAPSIHCNTHWDYCCGKPVNIQVTHPGTGLGRLPTPCVWPYAAGNPASVGSWELLGHHSGVFVVHAALLPNGKLLMFSGTAEINLPTESRVWDPLTDTMTTQDFTDDLFCSGHAQLPDGRILVNGGAIPGQGHGIKSTHVFDPFAETWTKVRDMHHARWYPTTLTLPNGKIITFSGRDENGAIVPQVEVYDPSADAWTELPVSANKTLEIYPSLHVMPDGKILYTGTRWAGSQAWMSPPASALFDPAANIWADVDDHVIPNRTEGFSVLLPPLAPMLEAHEHDDIPKPEKEPPTLSRVLVVGGPGDQRSAEIIDTAEAAPAWRRITDMNFPRTNVNGVILPDGTILFCTGIDGYKWGPFTPTLQAEIFDPQAETWTTMAAMSVLRQYHSGSILLPDGRVLNTGSVGGPGNIMSMEVYSPPYLFRGPRPKITSAPASVGYGAEFAVESPDACRIEKAALVRNSTITHHTNTDQRYLPLTVRHEGRCELRLIAPLNANIAPPGYYMLFLMDDCGVPSVARFVRLG